MSQNVTLKTSIHRFRRFRAIPYRRPDLCELRSFDRLAEVVDVDEGNLNRRFGKKKNMGFGQD